MTDAMRSEFEKWAEDKELILRFSTGRNYYLFDETESAWQAWQAARTVLEGFVMVPVEPTDEMLEAMEQAIIDMGVDVFLADEINKLAVWHDVLDAAPEGKK